MMFVQKTIENAAVGVAILDDPDGFTVFRKPGVAAAIWRRQLPADFQTWIDVLPIENLPATRTILRWEVAREAIFAICENAGVPESPHKHFLVEDVSKLCERFAEVMNSEFLQLRFDVVEDNACRKFHIDAVTARLVCTYRGAGTQYGISTDGAEPKRVYSVSTGAPILLRGTKWPEPPHSGLLHRSPPIEGTGTTRLVLVIDPISEKSISA